MRGKRAHIAKVTQRKGKRCDQQKQENHVKPMALVGLVYGLSKTDRRMGSANLPPCQVHTTYYIINNMKIYYYTKLHFGIPRVYVADETQAKAFHTLTKGKLVLPEHRKALEALGCTFEEVSEPNKK